jgi:hypothetical protein
MDQLFATIGQLVAEESKLSANMPLNAWRNGGIMEWQVAAGVADGVLVVERPDALPNPAVEIRECLPDGSEFKAVWSYLRASGVAKLVTVHSLIEANMRIPGERIKRTRLIQTDKYVIAVKVEMVIPVDDPSEPCLEAEAVKFLKEVRDHAERDDVAWLKQHGKVYAAVDVA